MFIPFLENLLFKPYKDLNIIFKIVNLWKQIIFTQSLAIEKCSCLLKILSSAVNRAKITLVALYVGYTVNSKHHI